jgi:hypothetical protein
MKFSLPAHVRATAQLLSSSGAPGVVQNCQVTLGPCSVMNLHYRGRHGLRREAKKILGPELGPEENRFAHPSHHWLIGQPELFLDAD